MKFQRFIASALIISYSAVLMPPAARAAQVNAAQNAAPVSVAELSQLWNELYLLRQKHASLGEDSFNASFREEFYSARDQAERYLRKNPVSELSVQQRTQLQRISRLSDRQIEGIKAYSRRNTILNHEAKALNAIRKLILNQQPATRFNEGAGAIPELSSFDDSSQPEIGARGTVGMEPETLSLISEQLAVLLVGIPLMCIMIPVALLVFVFSGKDFVHMVFG